MVSQMDSQPSRPGYILTKVDFESFKRYEYVSQTSLGEMTGEILIEHALALVDKCPKPE